MIKLDASESQAFRTAVIWVSIGTLLSGLIFGFPYALSFLSGGFLCALNLALLRHSINSALNRASNPKMLTIGSYLLRLLLIPLGLYAIIRLFFFGIIAAIAGFAVFGCGILFHGIRRVIKGSSR